MATHSDTQDSLRGVRPFQARIRRLFTRLNLTEQHFLVALAMIVGIGCGVGSILFRELFAFMHQLMQVEIP